MAFMVQVPKWKWGLKKMITDTDRANYCADDCFSWKWGLKKMITDTKYTLIGHLNKKVAMSLKKNDY